MLSPFFKWYNNDSWLTIGDGRFGADANYISHYASNVIATDITYTLLAEAQQENFIDRYQAQNAEAISLADNAIDLVYCKEALHHVPRPFVALCEMLRVARKGVVLLEPTEKTASMPLPGKLIKTARRYLSKLGLCKAPYDYEFEGSGNYLYTLSLREAEKVGISLNCSHLVYKHINDRYAVGMENELVADHGPLFKEISAKINRRDMLCKLGLRPYDLVFCALFHAALPQDQVNILMRQGYSVVSLPKTPHLVYAVLHNS